MSSQEGSSFTNKKNELQSSSSTRYLSLANSSATSSSTLRHLRTDLVEVLGPDLLVPTTEISSIPCAGVRIASGNLLGLMGWRLIVELDESEEMDRSWRRKQPGKSVIQHKKLSVVSNFILDTGSAKSSVSQETLRALKYQGSYNPGTEVKLRIQGISTQCLVATLGEASRLGGQFMTSGNLTFYFDKKLNAPVLYVGDESNERPTSHIPRTVNVTGMDHRNHRKSLRDSMSSILSSLSFMKHNDSGC
ncbi:hypothetical protein F5878DRAFT_537529 [Lentinula raphanica]|uniref:Uncharacterized protein n=1 Tax=Lentinula raphanica TaxID=153919 RepID=A0AA38UES7_9AGAR|nr:hypothetical protein C8R42DRAFT_588615 [Lentinula raphanica]KAJ3817111.1 hypothetical protein F5880DRAFT_1493429 [Lentinula raphanica]KAJ3838425.1 hypothetical protein F5878DRAFT_537529 [Lentinula raphanica]